MPKRPTKRDLELEIATMKGEVSGLRAALDPQIVSQFVATATRVGPLAERHAVAAARSRDRAERGEPTISAADARARILLAGTPRRGART
jgi:hypothetical protein